MSTVRGFDPRLRLGFALALLGLVALIVHRHGAGGLAMAAELAIPALLIAGWTGGTGLMDLLKPRRKD